jgi:steroid delta-isomerase-like uncharacterized protein
MSQTHTKELARQFLDVFSTGDVSALQAVLAHDVVDHNPLPGVRSGRDGIADAVALFRTGFPDLQVSVDHLVAEGDLVAAAGIATGINSGPIFGAPPTGNRATFAYLDLYRVSDGRITECWHVEDVAGMLAQLGLVPR